MKNNKKYIVILLAIAFFGFSLMCWVKPSNDFSDSERRELSKFPELSAETLRDGTFMTKFEKYTLDQFPFRDEFRSLKAIVSDNIFNKSDNNNIYVFNDYAVKMEYPMNKDSIKHASIKFKNIYDKYLKNNNKIYLSIIPDKNYFLAENSKHLSMDYDLFFEIMKNEMYYAEYIDITDLLDIEDYYKTDIHWRQEKITDVAKRISKTMGVELNGTYEEYKLDNMFYGVYFGQSALNLDGEELKYLTNENIKQCTVFNYENNKEIGIYDMEKAKGKDPYEIYLSGPVSLLEIKNPNATTEKELVIFRDSFGSSLAPLLIDEYKSITLVDVRYIQSNLLGNFINFDGKDILFLYSVNVLNNGNLLK